MRYGPTDYGDIRSEYADADMRSEYGHADVRRRISLTELPTTHEQRVFNRTQQIQQRRGESSAALHERLRDTVFNSFKVVQAPLFVATPSWYSFDASRILGIPDAVVLSTSTCKHETPMVLFVGRRDPGKLFPIGATAQGQLVYELLPLLAVITPAQRNAIYDAM